MVYRSCGIKKTNVPCIINGRCNKQYPWALNIKTWCYEDGYLIYWCQDERRIYIAKNRCIIDNYQGYKI